MARLKKTTKALIGIAKQLRQDLKTNNATGRRSEFAENIRKMKRWYGRHATVNHRAQLHKSESLMKKYAGHKCH